MKKAAYTPENSANDDSSIYICFILYFLGRKMKNITKSNYKSLPNPKAKRKLLQRLKYEYEFYDFVKAKHNELYLKLKQVRRGLETVE